MHNENAAAWIMGVVPISSRIATLGLSPDQEDADPSSSFDGYSSAETIELAVRASYYYS
jgi:hypothetical protein